MLDITFTVDGAEPLRFAAAPALIFKLRLAVPAESWQIHNVLLQCQIQIEATRRRYQPAEQDRLIDLFGTPERWGDTLRTMHWTHASVMVPAFQGSTVVDLHVPCTFDFNTAAAKYFYGVEGGEVPLALLFSGTIFYAADPEAPLQVARINWNSEARYRLPVTVWKQMMDHHYPNTVWLCLQRDVFERLYDYKRRHSIPTWEQAVSALLSADSRPSDTRPAEPGPGADGSEARSP